MDTKTLEQSQQIRQEQEAYGQKGMDCCAREETIHEFLEQKEKQFHGMAESTSNLRKSLPANMPIDAQRLLKRIFS